MSETENNDKVLLDATENDSHKWTREEVRQVLDELRKLPDFHRFPLPRFCYKEFNIPMPNNVIDNLNDYLKKHNQTQMVPIDEYVEIKETNGIVKEMPKGVEIKIEVKPKDAEESKDESKEIE